MFGEKNVLLVGYNFCAIFGGFGFVRQLGKVDKETRQAKHRSNNENQNLYFSNI